MNDKLTFITYVRFTEQERKVLQKMSDDYGMSLASVIRMYCRRGMKHMKGMEKKKT